VLDQHQRVRPEVDVDDSGRFGLGLAAMPLDGTARSWPLATNRHWCGDYCVKLPSKLKLEEPIEIVHL